MNKKFCKYMINSINIHHYGMSFCNKFFSSHDGCLSYNDKDFLKKFLDNRQSLINNIKNDKIPDKCSGCELIQEINEEEISEKINFIEIYTWLQCNCACFYCSNRCFTKLKITTEKNQKGVVDVMPILKQLHKENLLDKNLMISLVGGEPTLLKEFSDILKFVTKNKYGISILSNGILHDKNIVKALEPSSNSYLIVSLDSGTKETFKKIKGVDKFNDVIENLKKYIKEAKNAKNKIASKYIILEGVNDNKEEIDKWIEVCSSIGIKNYFPAIEFCNALARKEEKPISENVCELYEYIKTKVKEVNPEYNVMTYDFVENFIKNRSYNLI